MILRKFQVLGFRTRVRTCFRSLRIKICYDASLEMPAALPYKVSFAEIEHLQYITYTAAIDPSHCLYGL